MEKAIKENDLFAEANNWLKINGKLTKTERKIEDRFLYKLTFKYNLDDTITEVEGYDFKELIINLYKEFL
ncbi:hypothetical protein MCEGE10_01906 [Flavobacteriaceae bacterium]